MIEHGDEKFGEKRPKQTPGFSATLLPLKFARDCDPAYCTDHITVSGSVEQDMPVVANPLELIRLMQAGEPIPTEKQWVPIMRVLNSYN